MRADSPIFHQKQSGAYFTPSDVARELVSWALRVPSFVAFLAYCLHVTLRARLRPLAAGLTPRAVLDKLAAIQMLDVHFQTTNGRTLILSRYTEPNVDQKLLLRQLGLTPPPQVAAPAPVAQHPARHVVETFDRPALIPRLFPPARIPS